MPLSDRILNVINRATIYLSANTFTMYMSTFFFSQHYNKCTRNGCVTDKDAHAKWYWSQICHIRDISVHLADMLWTISILSNFDL